MTTPTATHPAPTAATPADKAADLTTRTLRSGQDLRALYTPATAPASAWPGSAFTLPLHGAADPGAGSPATTPGSFALAPDIGGPLMFASPDTPGMPAPSDKTAWDFLPEGWTVELLGEGSAISHQPSGSPDGRSLMADGSTAVVTFKDARGVTRRVTTPPGFTPITQLEHARLGTITPQMRRVAQREPHLTPEQVRDEIAAGRLIIPANIHHLAKSLDPMAIGRATKTKVNANMGASPVSSGTDEEVEKLRWAQRWGADTVMDLSTGGDLDACRQAIIDAATVPIGTVPIYSMIIGKRLEDLDAATILSTIEHQAKQGVDYMTVHAGLRKAHIPLVKSRLIGIVSRGGSLLAKWCLVHNAENPMYTLWDDICRILREHDVSFSIGDGLRPGGLADATDQAQLAELATIGELTERAWRHGVQVMVEGPGHVPFDQIEYNAKLQRRLCHGAPFYVLGPLVTDVFPGYDHITSCIGATAIAYHGAAMLCYVTPKEHLGLPKKGDVKDGCIAYKIAAHAADVALGIPGTRHWDDELTRARAALNWQRHFELAFDEDTARAYHDEDLDVDTDFCAMCGHDWCSVRISKEIQDFASGKADGFERIGAGGKPGAPVKSDALTPEQQTILAARGYLKPDEIHKLAAKVKKSVTPVQARSDSDGSPPLSPLGRVQGEEPLAGEGPRHNQAERAGVRGSQRAPRVSEGASAKAACHSDYTDPDEARRLQSELIQLNTAPAHNLPTTDRLI